MLKAKTSIDGAFGVGRVEREGRDLDIEMLARLRHHAVAADHEAGRRGQGNSAGIFERLARPESRLLADDARLGIQVNGHLSCRIWRRKPGFLTRVLMVLKRGWPG